MRFSEESIKIVEYSKTSILNTLTSYIYGRHYKGEVKYG